MQYWCINPPAALFVVLGIFVQSCRLQEDCGEFCCDVEGAVRLTGGRKSSEGYVEVCMGGAWGTVCDDHWDNRDAGVICSMLGFHRENAVASKFARFVSDPRSIENQPVVLDRVQCYGDESTILNCPVSTSEDCYNHIEDAGVVCEEDSCVEGDVRLMGGSDAKEGRVEVCRSNVWGTVCNDGWTEENALVVCTQLGLQDDSRDKHLAVDFGPGSTSPLLGGVQCDGDESTLTDCTSGELNETCYAAGVMCSAPCHFNDQRNGCSAIGVTGSDEHYNYDEFCYCSQYCHLYWEWIPDEQQYVERGDCCRDALLFDNCIAEPAECEENSVRIVNGTHPWNGRLEICVGGLWGAVCEDQFEDVDALVACRHLGFPTENAFAVPGGTFGESEKMWIRGVECTGEEQTLFHCQSSSPGYFHDCRAHNSTGIWCAGALAESECEDGDIRLAGGPNEMGGRVEICDGGVWGSVCNQEFGEEEANVVCKELGFTESASVVSIHPFGTGTGPIQLDDLSCQGNEPHLLQCNHSEFRVHNCYRHDEAAVACRADQLQRCDGLNEPPSLPTETLTRYGRIAIFEGLSEMCNLTYKRGVDFLFLPLRLNELPSDLSLQNEASLSTKLEDVIGQSFEAASAECQQLFSAYVCNSIFFRIENTTGNFTLPSPVCPEECGEVERMCPVLWKAFRETDVGEYADCNRTGRLLDPLPYCCHGAGIHVPLQNDSYNGPGGTDGPGDGRKYSSNRKDSSNVGGIAAGVTVAIIFLLVLSALLAIGLFLFIRKFRHLKTVLHGRDEAVNTLEMLSILHERRDSSRSLILNGKANGAGVVTHQPVNRQMSDDLIRYCSRRNSLTPYSAAGGGPYYPTLSPISSRYLRQLTTDMLIPQAQLRLLDTIGKGEFGMVYKAHYLPGPKNGRTAEPQIVAVKTLKGYFDKEAIHVLLEESVKMKQFDHPNVLTLFGVCVDAGPAPYIVMPFMAKGSLLSYLRKERHNIILTEKDESDDVEDVRQRLLDIIHQIAKGMAYLAERKFVHRDLATRNCMMDIHNVIRISDFGLSEDMYAKNYFRQDKDAAVKLPVKWMAPESLNDGIFTEKTDVWSYGVTCWEVFSGGKTPYPGVNPVSLVRVLEDGERLEKPPNTACPQFAYKLMLDCWQIEPQKRPAFQEIAREVDHIMEVTAGYLTLTTVADQREGQVMVGMRSGTDSPESVSQLIKGVTTDAGITIQLDECTNSSQESSQQLVSNETNV